MKPTRVLWNQFIGFIFMIFAIFFAVRMVVLIIDSSRHPSSNAAVPVVKLCIAAVPTAAAAWFALTSFLRARRISRS